MLLDASGDPIPAQALRGVASSAHIAAQPSDARTPLLMFNKDTRQMLTPWSHTTLMLKSRTLVENVGNAAAVENLAMFIGWLMPQADSGDEDWNELAEERFRHIAMSPLVFDAAGRHTFKTAQRMLMARSFVDGDIFTIFTETEDATARLAFREAHQVCNDYGDWKQEWRMGVKTDSNNRPTHYRFCDPGYSAKPYVLDALHVHQMAHLPTLGQTRGTPVLKHALNDLHDILETKSYVKHAIKVASRLGIYRDVSPKDAPGFPSGFQSVALQQQAMYSDCDPGELAPLTMETVEELFGSGMIAKEKLGVVHDERPHPNQGQFADRILRETAVGLGVPHQIMYFMDDPGGAWSRILLEAFSRFVVEKHALHLMPWCQRVWTYVIAKEMKAGRLRAPRGRRAKFWKVRWCPQRSMTADLGKMGKLAIELRRSLMTTYAQHYEELGLDYEDQLRQCAKEARMLLDLEAEYGLPAGMLREGLSQPNSAVGRDDGENQGGGDNKPGQPSDNNP
jgi:capsid protein